MNKARAQRYVDRVMRDVRLYDGDEPEFIEAVSVVLPALVPVLEQHPEYEASGLLERLVQPERVIGFRVSWIDDAGKVRVNRAWRVQFNSAIGPYKGGLRFHPTVTLSVLKFLAFEQTFKNALTGLPMGGAKGGSDFDPKGKSDGEIMRFCQAFMDELYRHIGHYTDIPAGDIGVGERETGYLYGRYKKLTNSYTPVLTGKGRSYSGSKGRPEATGFGLVYIAREYLLEHGRDLKGARVAVSGSGNVALHAAEKAAELGATVITLSDSSGWIFDPNGIDIETAKFIKNKRHGRIEDYAAEVSGSAYTPGRFDWSPVCDIAFPCATQNELNAEEAGVLIGHGVSLVCEGANMPATPEAQQLLQSARVGYIPGKAANAGGVAVSGLEISQNEMRLSWSFEEVDQRLHTIMADIYRSISEAAARCGEPENYVLGANVAGFEKIAEAMYAEGLI